VTTKAGGKTSGESCLAKSNIEEPITLLVDGGW